MINSPNPYSDEITKSRCLNLRGTLCLSQFALVSPLWLDLCASRTLFSMTDGITLYTEINLSPQNVVNMKQ